VRLQLIDRPLTHSIRRWTLPRISGLREALAFATHYGVNVVIEEGVVVGNVTTQDQVGGIAGRLVAGFDRALTELFEEAEPSSVHEVGCGEGRNLRIFRERFSGPLRGTDDSAGLIQALRQNADFQPVALEVRTLEDLHPAEDSADLVVCEVLEHVADPDIARKALRALPARRNLFSVPREPLWRTLNCKHGKYPADFGNTSGHVNHWSRAGFCEFLRRAGFQIRRLRRPPPWTMVLAEVTSDE